MIFSFDYHRIWHSQLWLSVIAGLLLGLSFPPFPFPFLSLPSFVCIFRIVDLSSSAREAAFWSYPAFLIWNIIVTYWLAIATVPAGIAAFLANSAVMTLPVMLQHRFQYSKLPGWLIALLQAGAWISFEYLHHHWQLAWPWLTIGNSWANMPHLIQYLNITGLWGASFWILFTAALIYQAISNGYQRLAYLAVMIFLIFPLLSFALSWMKTPQPLAKTQQVIVVQPNFDSYERYGGFSSGKQAINHLLKLSDSLRTPGTDLIVWPENAIQRSISSLSSSLQNTNSPKIRLLEKTRRWNVNIIGGSIYYDFFNPAEAPPLPYYNHNNKPYLPYNAAFNFSPNQPMQVYKKHELVPVVERVPYIYFLNAIDIFGWVDWNSIQGYGRGQQTNPFSIGQTHTPALICYDSVFPGWVRQTMQSDSGFLTIITNDGWWGNTSGHAQHFAYARLRAIEFGRWIVRSANNGISGIIAPDGSIMEKSLYDHETVFKYEVPVLSRTTFYKQYGDWLAFIFLAFTAFGWGWTFYYNLRLKRYA